MNDTVHNGHAEAVYCLLPSEYEQLVQVAPGHILNFWMRLPNETSIEL